MAPTMTHPETPGTFGPEVAKTIVAALSEAGISRLEASTRTGIPRETFYRKASGKVPFNVDELALIAHLLDTTPTALAARAERGAA